MANLVEVFRARAERVINCVHTVVPRWYDKGYKLGAPLASAYDASEAKVQFWLPSDPRARIEFNSIKPKDLINVVIGASVTLKDEKIDAASELINNLHGKSPLEEEYEATFEETTSAEDAITAGMSVSATETFKEGGDLSPVEAEQSLTESVYSEFSRTTSKGASVSRMQKFNVSVEPGDIEKVFGTRSVAKIKQRITGVGDFTFKLIIGDFHPNHWHDARSWDSWDDFIEVINGKAPDNYPLATNFHGSTPTRCSVSPYANPTWVAEPLSAPFEMDIEYDDVTDTDLTEQSMVKTVRELVQRIGVDGVNDLLSAAAIVPGTDAHKR